MCRFPELQPGGNLFRARPARRKQTARCSSQLCCLLFGAGMVCCKLETLSAGLRRTVLTGYAMRRVRARDQFVSGGAATDYLNTQDSYGFFGRPTGEWRLVFDYLLSLWCQINIGSFVMSLRAQVQELKSCGPYKSADREVLLHSPLAKLSCHRAHQAPLQLPQDCPTLPHTSLKHPGAPTASFPSLE